MEKYIALIGLGAVGAPIAHKLYRHYGNDFILLSDLKHVRGLEKVKQINKDDFSPNIISSKSQLDKEIGIIIISVKNYDLISTSKLLSEFVSKNTVLVPLENGTWACRYLRNKYKDLVVAECFVRGPDTQRKNNMFEYTKSGVVHIGTSRDEEKTKINEVFSILKDGNIDIHLEKNINLLIWRKWMLNVAGNTVTALTDADYGMFKDNKELQLICRSIMREFLMVAKSEGVALSESDIDETIDYFVGYPGSKITSMLEDVRNKQQTENEYITGELLRLADEKNIKLPINKTIYTLINIKEYVYLKKKEGAENV